MASGLLWACRAIAHVFDQFFKEFVRRALEPWGNPQVGTEISAFPQEADLLFEPDPSKAGREVQLGLLGRITSSTCLLEAFHDPPSVEDMLVCYRKQLTLHHQKASRGNQQTVPVLWVFSSGVPRGALRGL